MGDDIVLSSTTDTPEDIKAALKHGTEAPPEDTVLGVVDDADAPGEPEVKEPPAAEAAPEKDKKDEPAEKKDEPAEGAPVKKAKPQRSEFKTEDEFKTAVEKFNVQKRVDKLTWEKNEEKRKREAAESELATLRAANASGRKLPEPSEAEREAAEAAAEPEPKPEDFETHDQWVKALTVWSTKQEVARQFKEQRQKDAEAADRNEQDAMIRRYADTKVEAQARYSDFDAVIKANEEMPVTGTMSYAMVKAGGLGHDMAYYLATHRDEADRIAALGDTPDAIEAMGELKATVRAAVARRSTEPDATDDAAGAGEDERQQEGRPAAEAEKPKPPVVSKTPNPIAPVGGRAANTKKPLDELPYPDYKARREQEERDRHKRIHGR